MYNCHPVLRKLLVVKRRLWSPGAVSIHYDKVRCFCDMSNDSDVLCSSPKLCLSLSKSDFTRVIDD